MLGQLNILGKDKVQTAIERLKYFEPEQGYYLAFSGGKDSIAIYYLAKMAGVKFEAVYNHTTVDPPELVYFIRELRDKNKDIRISYPSTTMWKLIVEKRMPPTRLVRYCCEYFKERGGEGRFVVTGVRWEESVRRKKTRQMIEFDMYGSQSKESIERRKIFMMSDNEEKRRMIESCVIKGKNILNPIIDWTESEVWEFIKKYNLPYCKLYDEGFSRLGCVGCPMGGRRNMLREFERYPKFKENFIRAFDRMISKREKDGLETGSWKTGKDVFNWWLGK